MQLKACYKQLQYYNALNAGLAERQIEPIAIPFSKDENFNRVTQAKAISEINKVLNKALGRSQIISNTLSDRSDNDSQASTTERPPTPEDSPKPQ